jgi:hypothetical protein
LADHGLFKEPTASILHRPMANALEAPIPPQIGLIFGDNFSELSSIGQQSLTDKS